MQWPSSNQIMIRSGWDAETDRFRWEVVPESEWRAPSPPPEETLNMITQAIKEVCYLNKRKK